MVKFCIFNVKLPKEFYIALKQRMSDLIFYYGMLHCYDFMLKQMRSIKTKIGTNFCIAFIVLHFNKNIFSIHKIKQKPGKDYIAKSQN